MPSTVPPTKPGQSRWYVFSCRKQNAPYRATTVLTDRQPAAGQPCRDAPRRWQGAAGARRQPRLGQSVAYAHRPLRILARSSCEAGPAVEPNRCRHARSDPRQCSRTCADADHGRASRLSWRPLLAFDAGHEREHGGGSRRLAERAKQKQRALEASAADAAQRATAAEDRVARLKRGEAVTVSITKPLDVSAMLRSLGWSTCDLSRAAGLAALSQAEFALFLDEARKAMERAETAVDRTALRKVLAQRTAG